MLKAQYRLSKTKDIERVLKNGRGAGSASISIKAAPNKLKHSRFAFVVGLKVSKSAVRRNRIRRQMREVVRLHLDAIAPGHDVMVMARPKARDIDYKEIEKEILRHFKKLKLL